VAIGLVLLIEASPALQGLASGHQDVLRTMVNVVLLSVFVNELAGPPLSRMAILRGNQPERAHESI
jgi:hypothetical protein